MTREELAELMRNFGTNDLKWLRVKEQSKMTRNFSDQANLYVFSVSRELAADNGFYDLLAAMVRNADSDNLQRIKDAWPGFAETIRDRYNSPGGVLPGESGYDEIQEQRAKLGLLAGSLHKKFSGGDKADD